MKFITLFILTALLGKGCTENDRQDLANAVLVYEANARGFYQKITIQNQMVYVKNDRNNDSVAPKKISDKNWKDLLSDFDAINLDELSNLKAPTEKRFYDGAPIGNLKVTYKEKTYETNGFDHGFPPLEILKLVNKINCISGQQ